MANTPYPLPRQTRESNILVGNGTPGPYGPTSFQVFDVADITVLAAPTGERFRKVTSIIVTKTSGLPFDTVSVTFGEDVPPTTEFVIQARRTHERSVAVTRSGSIDSEQLEKELSKQATVLSELRRDIDNGIQLPPGTVDFGFPPSAPDKLIGWNAAGNGLENKTVIDLDGELLPAAPNTVLVRNALNTGFETKPAGTGGLELLAYEPLLSPALIRNRNLDQVLFTDFFTSNAKLNDYRGGGNPVVTQELNDMDAALASGGSAALLPRPFVVAGPVIKKPDTWWDSPGSTVLNTITCAYNGAIFDITGAGARDGGIEGFRLIGNKAAYPAAIAFNLNGVHTHEFRRMRIGGFNYGIYGANCKAIVMDNVYTFDCLLDGVMLEGTTPGDPTTNTDHRFFDCQFTGDRYGLHGKNGATFRLTACRPQSSGTANVCFETLFDTQMIGGYCDSASIHASGGGEGMRIIDSQRLLVDGVNFYSNGDTTPPPGGGGPAFPMINIFANNGNASDLTFANNIFTRGGGQTALEGIQFSAPLSSNLIQRVTIDGNNFVGTDTPIAGSGNVASGLRVGKGNVFPTGFGAIEQLTETGSALTPARAYSEIFRQGGTAVAYDFNLPAAGNYEGKEYFITRVSGSGGAITIKNPSGSTVATLAASAGAWARIVCTTASSTPGSVVFTKLAGS